VVQPEILLLDEAFAALDPVGRQQCMRDLRSLQQAQHLTVIHVTHAWDEAHTLADRVAVVMEGRMVQQGPVQEVFARPVSEPVARFVGTENILPGKIVARTSEGSTVEIGGVRICAGSDVSFGSSVTVCIRGAAWMVNPAPQGRQSAENFVTGILQERTRLGDLERIVVDCGIPLVAVARNTDLQKQHIRAGDTVTLHVDPSDVHLIHRGHVS
jgi:ABC-type Fe3+/spermidine/putrescine transport system ATPase subunit